MSYIDWSDFTPQEFLEYCKEKLEETFSQKLMRDIADGFYNIATWLEESLSPSNKTDISSD